MATEPFTQLARLGDNPTLAEITWAWSAEYSRAPGILTEFNRQRFTAYDQRFGHRVEYQLWRKLGSNAKATSNEWASPQEIEHALSSARDPFVFMPLLYLLTQAFTPKGREAFTSDTLREMTEVIESGIRRDFPIPQELRPNAAFIEVLLRDAIESNQFNRTPVRALNHLHNVERLLYQIDPHWKRGKALSDKALRTARPILPKGRMSLFRSILTALGNCNNIASAAFGSVRNLTSETEELTQIHAVLAITLWNTARTSLRGEKLLRDDMRLGTFRWNLDDLTAELEYALRGAVNAAHSAGWYLRCAALAHVLFRTGIEGASKRSISHYARFIHQAGFERDEEISLTPSAVKVFPRRPNGPYWLRIRNEQNILPEWNQVLSSFPRWKPRLTFTLGAENLPAMECDPYHLIRGLAHDCEDLGDESIFRCAFQLALRYSWISLAARLLERFEPTKLELLSFVYHVKKAQESLPFGIDGVLHSKWSQTIRKCWCRLSGVEFSDEDALVMHEVLHGRGTQILRSPAIIEPLTFARKYQRLLSQSETNDLYVSNPGVLRRGPSTINTARVRYLLKVIGDTQLGPPVSVSIVSSDRNHLQVIVANAAGSWSCKSLSLPGFSDGVDHLMNFRDSWIYGIPWPQQFKEFCYEILKLARSSVPNCNWLMLAVEPCLSVLPWQDLVFRCGNPNRPTLVSQIPSFGWAGLSVLKQKPAHGMRSPGGNGGGIIAMFNDEKVMRDERGLYYTKGPSEPHDGISTPGYNKYNFADVSEVEDLRQLYREVRASVCVEGSIIESTAFIVGHGTYERQCATVMAASGTLGPEGWLRFGNYRTVVVHSCSSGLGESGFLGDLSGIPNLVLGMGTRLVCAPVADVPLDAASCLHRHHTASNGVPLEFGVRYLNAIKECSRVALYNLYGFANQSVRLARPNSRYSGVDPRSHRRNTRMRHRP